MDRLSAAKTKQEAAEQERKTRVEKEVKRDELFTERERVMKEMAATEQAAAEAKTALAELETMEAQGELDEAVASELAEIRADAEATLSEFNARKADMERIDAEIASLESGEREAIAETAQPRETPPAEAVIEEPASEGVLEGGSEPEHAKEQITSELEETEKQIAEAQAQLDDLRAQQNESSKMLRELKEKNDNLMIRRLGLREEMSNALLQFEGKRDALQSYVDGQLMQYLAGSGERPGDGYKESRLTFDLNKAERNTSRNPKLRPLLDMAKRWNELSEPLKPMFDTQDKLRAIGEQQMELERQISTLTTKTWNLRNLLSQPSETQLEYIQHKESNT